MTPNNIDFYLSKLDYISKNLGEFDFNSDILPLLDYLHYYVPCNRESALIYEDCKTSIQIQMDLDDIVTIPLNDIARLMKILGFICVCVDRGYSFVWKMQRIKE